MCQQSSLRFKWLHSELSSEFIRFFDFQLFFAQSSALAFFLLPLVRFVRFLGFLWLFRRFVWWFRSRLRLRSMTPTMRRTRPRARSRMATMSRRTTSASVSSSSMWRGTRSGKQKHNFHYYKKNHVIHRTPVRTKRGKSSFQVEWRTKRKRLEVLSKRKLGHHLNTSTWTCTRLLRVSNGYDGAPIFKRN